MKPGTPGYFTVADERGVRLAHWTEAAYKGTPTGGAPDPSEEIRTHFAETAPPIVRTTARSKAERMASVFADELGRRAALLGRPLTVADLSPQWLEAMRIEALKSDGYNLKAASEFTPEVLKVIAAQYLEIERQKLEQHKGKVVRDI